MDVDAGDDTRSSQRRRRPYSTVRRRSSPGGVFCGFVVKWRLAKPRRFVLQKQTSPIERGRNYGPTDHGRGRGLSSRKFLVTTTSFDFAPFYRDRQHYEHEYQRGGDVDPRYTDEKPLVPTGPNPLHH
ncbi:hypothetical protein Droror1_Dr00022366 [Drosera rotundifolia]